MVTTMRFYLEGPLSDQQMDNLALRFASDAGDYKKDSSGFYVEIRHRHLDLSPEDIISKELMNLSIVKVTMMIGAKWLYDRFGQNDALSFTSEDGKTSATHRYWYDKATYHTLLIVGPTVEDVLSMLNKLKNGDMDSHQDLREKITALATELKDLKAQHGKEVESYKQKIKDLDQLFRMKTETLEAEVLYYRKPWYLRLSAKRIVNVIPYSFRPTI